MFTDAEIEELAKKAASIPFRPTAFYDASSDSLDFLNTRENYYAQTLLDQFATVYISEETGRPIGFRLTKIKQFLKALLKNAPGFKSEIHDHRIKVEHLFTAKIWADSPTDARNITYKALREIARENAVEAEIDDLGELVA